MSEMDESFRGLREGEDSIANKPVDRLSKNKNLAIFNNISSENVPDIALPGGYSKLKHSISSRGPHNNSNSFNKDSMINTPSVFPSQVPKRYQSNMATEANAIFGAGRDDSSMNSPNLHSDREIVTHGNIGLGSGVVGIIPNSQQNKNKFSRARSNDKGK